MSTTITYEGTLPGSRIRGELIERHDDGSVTVVHPDGGGWTYRVRPDSIIEDAGETTTAADTFESLLDAMSNLTWMPVDAREQFDAMLRVHFTGSINEDVCADCEAHPGDNDHCSWGGSPHTWHVCGDHLRTAFIDSNCPEAVR